MIGMPSRCHVNVTSSIPTAVLYGSSLHRIGVLLAIIVRIIVVQVYRDRHSVITDQIATIGSSHQLVIVVVIPDMSQT